MRNFLIDLIYKNIRKNDFFLTADLGFSVLEKIKKKLKKNFLNLGVSENNMFLVAAGLANSLKKNKIYVYSICSFLIIRSLEIIKNYISNDSITNIRMIGVGSGASYNSMGKTHFSFDDLNAIYNYKGIIILNPCNFDELNFVFKKFNNINQTLYYRINKNIVKNKFKLKKNGNYFIKKGKKGNIISSGYIINLLPDLLGGKVFSDFNIISLPIVNFKYNKDINKHLVDGNVYMVADAFSPIFFYEIKKLIKNKKVKILDLQLNKVKKTGSELDILKQMGLKNSFFN